LINIKNACLADVERLAESLSCLVKAGDFIALHGDLGAGKTAFARAFIKAMFPAGAKPEVPSPTFCLLQLYDAGRLQIYHFDFYRLSDPGGAFELGLEDALCEGVTIAEWPENIAELLPHDRLEVLLEEVPGKGPLRNVRLSAHGIWKKRLEHLQTRLGFINAAGWSTAASAFLQGDASARSYARLHMQGKTAILMDAPNCHGDEYSKTAHIAADVGTFVKIANALRQTGIRTPEILASDPRAGFLLIEDFGDRVFGSEIANGRDLSGLYKAAVDVLLILRQHPPASGLQLPNYDLAVLGIETALLLDWYWPMHHEDGQAPLSVREDYTERWHRLFRTALQCETGWMLRDYHSPNLLWLAENEVGVIDFQDALVGPLAYDLVSLLQDARLDIPADVEHTLLDYYCARVSAEGGFDEERFRTCYAILGAQRNSRILGVFARLAKRDGRPEYLRHIPRVREYLFRNLAHPALAELRNWYAENLPKPENPCQ
jgi:tRNA threonylcarbamoyl adenosine modification protein YjeE